MQSTLQRVTVTGADDATDISQIFELSLRFPHVEWGILVSQRHKGHGRFPGYDWIERLYDIPQTKVARSLHVCGAWVRQLLLGEDPSIPDLLTSGADRVQLNFHGERVPYRHADMINALEEAFYGLDVIFQIDGVDGLSHCLVADGEWQTDGIRNNAHALYDLSHGAGVLPSVWPGPLMTHLYQGYAGGLGPENVVEQLGKINEAANGNPYWIDMETLVRTDGKFDLKKVEQVLALTAPLIQPKHR